MSSNPITDMTVYCEKHDRKRLGIHQGRVRTVGFLAYRPRSAVALGHTRRLRRAPTDRRLTRKEAEYGRGRGSRQRPIRGIRRDLHVAIQLGVREVAAITVEARDDHVWHGLFATRKPPPVNHRIGLAKLVVLNWLAAWRPSAPMPFVNPQRG